MTMDPLSLEGIEERLDREERVLVRARLAELRESERGLPPAYSLAHEERHALTQYLPHIERMAAQGMHPEQMAYRLGLSPWVFFDAIKHFSDLRLAVTGGAARGVDEQSAALYRAGVVHGQVAAQTFHLRTRGGFREPKEQAPSVVVNIGTEASPRTVQHAGTLAERQRALIEGSFEEVSGSE